MPKTKNKQVGKIGENLAVLHLQNKGYQILERNWGNKWGEIDIIARDKDTLIFVEVKTKVGITFGSPEEMINQFKLARIQKIASFYPLSEKSSVRIDIVAVVLNYDLTNRSLAHYQAVY